MTLTSWGGKTSCGPAVHECDAAYRRAERRRLRCLRLEQSTAPQRPWLPTPRPTHCRGPPRSRPPGAATHARTNLGRGTTLGGRSRPCRAESRPAHPRQPRLAPCPRAKRRSLACPLQRPRRCRACRRAATPRRGGRRGGAIRTVRTPFTAVGDPWSAARLRRQQHWSLGRDFASCVQRGARP